MLKKYSKHFILVFFVILASVGVLHTYLGSQPFRPAIDREIFKNGNPPFLVFAHRGGGGVFPENTLPAFEYSARMGVDVIELDVHATKDGALVVIHDPTLERTTNGMGKISEMTLSEVKKLDAAYRFTQDKGKTYPFRGKGITVPTLEEVFMALPSKKFNLEPKQAAPSLAKPLCNLIRERSMQNHIIVGSFKHVVLEDFRLACPEVATSASPSEVTRFLAMYKSGIGESYHPPMEALQIPKKLGQFEIVTKEFVAIAHKLNLKIHVWTINDPKEMKELIDLGVDGIMTDYPERLFPLLKRKAEITTR